MKRKKILPAAGCAAAALAAGLVLTAGMGEAWAYFTTYTSASGSYTIDLSNETQIVEEYSNHTKRLVVTNDGTRPVYVRARAFSGSQCALAYSSEDGRWQAGNDGYYYFSEPLAGAVTAEDGTVSRARTSELLVQIEFPADAEEGDGCNVVVIYESIPVQYDADGNALAPQAADWSVPLVSGSTEGGND